MCPPEFHRQWLGKQKICNITETEDAVTFFCDGKEVSQETYWETIEAHNSKEEAKWIPY